MKKWEYFTCSIDEDFSILVRATPDAELHWEHINKAGAAGWELVTISWRSDGDSMAIFKRRGDASKQS